MSLTSVFCMSKRLSVLRSARRLRSGPSAEAPLSAQPRPKVRNGVVLGVARDELGVERIVRYRILQ